MARPAQARGRLVVPLRVRGMGRLLTFTAENDHWHGGGWEQCGFVRMRGEGAAQDSGATFQAAEGIRLRVLTASGVFLGSVRYVAPERAQGPPPTRPPTCSRSARRCTRPLKAGFPSAAPPVATLTAVLFDPPPPCVGNP